MDPLWINLKNDAGRNKLGWYMRPPVNLFANCLTLLTAGIATNGPARNFRILQHQPTALCMSGRRAEHFAQAAGVRRACELSQEELLGIAACCVPPLEGTVKGGAGRVATIGGSLEYTGAPYFAAAAALRAGVDLSHVFCDRTAGPPLKSYSPELIVHPLLMSAMPGEAHEEDHSARVTASLDAVGPWIPRCDAFLVGPGLGRDTAVMEACSRLIIDALALRRRVVLDADGTFILSSALGACNRSPAQVRPPA